MIKADLHIHSIISDGSKTIDEIIAIAVENGLDMIAITDHDTLEQMKYIPPNPPIKIITGVEISAIDKETGVKAHIIGYNVKKPEIIEELTLPLLEKRQENSLKQIEKLVHTGLTIDVDKIKKADGKYIYKQHIMEYLFKTKQIDEMYGRFYRTTFRNGGVCDFDIDYIDMYDAVKAIKASGGKAVLAHAGQQQNFYLIEKLDLDGLEYNHLANKEEDKKKLKKYADKYNLFLTGGSDFHGDYDVLKMDIGNYQAEVSGAQALGSM